MNVDMMDDITLFRINQLTKEKSNLPSGKIPTLILTDSTGNKRLSLANFGQLQEIREQKALIDTVSSDSQASLSGVIEDRKEAEDLEGGGKMTLSNKINK